jgi:hypothetical protein
LVLYNYAPEKYCRDLNAVVYGLVDALGAPPDVIDEDGGEEE